MSSLIVVKKGRIRMETDKYTVGKLLGETEQFRIYECPFSDGRVGILKIAVSQDKNGILDREAFILQTLREEATRYEEEYQKKHPGKSLGYDIQFPNLVESFIAPDQGDRRVNIMHFVNVVDDLGRLVPIEHVIARDKVRVDPRTSAWIMGKTLKLLSFAHGQGISLGNVTTENILLERKEHYVVCFDWSQAVIHGGHQVPTEITSEEISQVAKAVILLLGGDPDTGDLPSDPQLEDHRYANYLEFLASGHAWDAFQSHADFYQLIRNTLGWRGYHPFTTYSLERS